MSKKSKIIIATIIVAIASLGVYSFMPTANAHECATCRGTGTCNACKNCKYCGHCAKGGGTCSVCR